MQRPTIVPSGNLALGGLSIGTRLIRENRDVGIENRIQHLDPAQRRFNQFDGRQIAAGDGTRGFDEVGERHALVHGKPPGAIHQFTAPAGSISADSALPTMYMKEPGWIGARLSRRRTRRERGKGASIVSSSSNV